MEDVRGFSSAARCGIIAILSTADAPPIFHHENKQLVAGFEMTRFGF